MSAAFPAFLGKHQKAKCNALTNRGRVVTREHPRHFFLNSFVRTSSCQPARRTQVQGASATTTASTSPGARMRTA